jgi:hypothetical protein
MPTLDDLIGYEPPSDVAVTQDAYSKVYLPATTAEWQLLLSGTSLNAPSSFWVGSEASGVTLTDRGAGGRNVTIAGAPTLGAAAPGWAATGIKCADASTTQFGTFTGSDVNTTSGMLLTCWAVNSNPAATRRLNNLGGTTDEGTRLLTGTSGPKVGAISGANTATGVADYSAIMVVVTKLDRANSVLGTYTRGEQVKATWSAPAASTTSYLFGHTSGSSDASFVYGAYWSGADAEIGDALVQQLIDFVYGDSTTLSKLQSGSAVVRLVAAIEGCEYLLCEGNTDAVLRAWEGTDWTSALGGLYVELKNSQTVTPWEPFTGAGSCRLLIVDTDGSDTFGELVNKRLAGAESELTETLDRNDTTIKVAATQDFSSSGTAFIGTEAIGYAGKTSTTLTGATRGKWSPFGCAANGSGGRRFAGHHRVGPDPYRVETRPLVTQLPRVWLGKRVGVWLHTFDPLTGTLNSRDEAQLVYAGRIAGIADDPNNFATTIDVSPVHDEIREGVIGRDMWSCTVAEGLAIVEGRAFQFEDWKYTFPVLHADPLTVVASGATGTNEINAGRYTLGEICQKLNAWLAGETAAGRIYGYYSWDSPVTSNVGMRSKCYFRIPDGGTDYPCSFAIDMPAEVMAFLGLTETEPANGGQTERFTCVKRTNSNNIAQGSSVPFTNLIFKPLGPGRLAQEFSQAVSYTAENEKGVLVDQYSALPQVIKASCDPTKPWALLLLNESALIVASYTDGVITNCWLAPFQATADKDKSAATYIGRRVDEPEGGEITLRQIFVLESSLSTLLATMVYGTGTAGYNHSQFDALGSGYALGIPGELLGGSFENSLTSLPSADAPIAVTIDEPTKFVDLFSADLIIRRAFLRWKDESFEFAQWKTPLVANAIADLTESNKAAPADHQENHRIATLETSEHARPVIKIDYSRDFAIGRDGQYLKSIQLEDQTAVDDAGGNVKPFTIKLRNGYHDLQTAGAAVEALIPDFLAFMPALARPTRIITRSIDLRFFEGLGVGDIVTVTDAFARDPLTGRRGIDERPAFISRISYDIGGPSADGSVRPMGGDIELMFMDLHRSEIYAPAAEIDSTAANAGYDAGTKTLTCLEHAYSHSVSFNLTWGRISRSFFINEPSDASRFEVGDLVNVIEMDSLTPLTWADAVASQSGDSIGLTSGLAGWDATKRYRVVYQKYSEVTGEQQDYAFQADSTDRMIEDLDPFFHYAGSRAGIGSETFVSNTGNEPAELVPTIAYGDGRPQDPAYDRALIHSLNGALDYATGYQMPFMWGRAAGSGTGTWSVVFAGPIFLGFDNSSSVVSRPLTVAPIFESLSGSLAKVRATLSRIKPMVQTSQDEGWSAAHGYHDPLYTAEYSQTAEWTTTSTSKQLGDDKTLGVSVKDLTWGFAWLVIETDDAAVHGLSKCVVGPRALTTAGNALLQGVNEL